MDKTKLQGTDDMIMNKSHCRTSWNLRISGISNFVYQALEILLVVKSKSMPREHLTWARCASSITEVSCNLSFWSNNDLRPEEDLIHHLQTQIVQSGLRQFINLVSENQDKGTIFQIAIRVMLKMPSIICSFLELVDGHMVI